MSVDSLQLSLKIAIFFKFYQGNFTTAYQLKNCNSIFLFFFVFNLLCSKHFLQYLGTGKIVKTMGHLSKKKVFSLPKLAKVVKNRGSKILTSKISAVTPISAYKPLFLGEFECFVPFLSIWEPKNIFSAKYITNIGEPRRTSKQRFVNWYFQG